MNKLKTLFKTDKDQRKYKCTNLQSHNLNIFYKMLQLVSTFNYCIHCEPWGVAGKIDRHIVTTVSNLTVGDLKKYSGRHYKLFYLNLDVFYDFE